MLGVNFIYLLMNKIYLQTFVYFFAVFKFTIKKTSLLICSTKNYRLFVSIKCTILAPIYRTQGDSIKHSRQKSSFKRQNTAYHRSRIC